MWNPDPAQYSRSRSHSFSNHTRQPAVYDSMRAPSPAFPTPQVDRGMLQPSSTPPPMTSSPGGFVFPQLGSPQHGSRAAKRGPGLSREQRHYGHTHTHNPSHENPTDHHHHHHHRHEQKHRHRHNSHSDSNNHAPNITVHAYGQAFTVPRPAHKYNHSVPVINGQVTTAPSVRLTNGASYVSRPSAPTHSIVNPTPPIQLPIPRTPPKKAQYYGPQTENKRHYFQYSQCTGRKKALCVGINYVGQANELNGCINDAKRMRTFLIKRYGFLAGDIVLLTDDGKTQRERPTKKNILDAMHWLVRDAHPHDSLVFHYSGHGGQTKDLDGDESDGYDEVIYSADWKEQGHIVDDDMHTIMVKPLPAGCRMTAIFDCCHSGSALDLPYMYGTGGKVKRELNFARASGEDSFSAGQALFRENDVNGLTRAFDGLMRWIGHDHGAPGKHARMHHRIIKTSPADVISWSGCKDSQTSADTYEAGSATGAMSYAFMKTLKEKPDQSYRELLTNIRKILKHQFSQIPQLSSSHPIDTSVKFIL